jgi:hypothetical protein
MNCAPWEGSSSISLESKGLTAGLLDFSHNFVGFNGVPAAIHHYIRAGLPKKVQAQLEPFE